MPIKQNGATSGFVTLDADATTGGGIITTNAASAVPLTVKGATAQTANIFEVEDVGGTILFGISSAGALVGANSGMAGWTVWTPASTQITLGTGSSTGYYTQVGKTVHVRGQITLGTGFAFSGAAVVINNLPVTGSTNISFVGNFSGVLAIGSARYAAIVRMGSSTSLNIDSFGASGLNTIITATVPATWASADAIRFAGTYEAN